MTNKIQKIRQKVEKLISQLFRGACSLQVAMETRCKEAYNEVLAILDTEDPVNNELEDAAKHYLYSNILYDDVYVGNPTDKDCIEMFKAGAEWQKRQDYFNIIYPRIITKGTIEQYAYQVAYDMSNDWAIDNPTWNDVENACKLGAKWKEQQMMKNSISKSVCLSLTGPYVELDQDDIHQLGLLFGDKIKLIVIKED